MSVEATESRYRLIEILKIQRQSKALWARLRRGNDSAVLRACIERLEVLLMALGGSLEVLAEAAG